MVFGGSLGVLGGHLGHVVDSWQVRPPTDLHWAKFKFEFNHTSCSLSWFTSNCHWSLPSSSAPLPLPRPPLLHESTMSLTTRYQASTRLPGMDRMDRMD